MNRMQYEQELSMEIRPSQEIAVQANVCSRPFTDNNNYAIRAEILQNQMAKLGITWKETGHSKKYQTL